MLWMTLGQEVLEEEVHLLVDGLLLCPNDCSVVCCGRVADWGATCCCHRMEVLLILAVFVRHPLLLLQEVRATSKGITGLEMNGRLGNNNSCRLFHLLLLLLKLFFGGCSIHHVSLLQSHKLRQGC